MGRPAKKKAYWESKKAEQGRLQAQIEYARKVPLIQRLQPVLEDSLRRIDPLELAAVTGLTITIRQLILVNEDWLKAATFQDKFSVGAIEAIFRILGHKVMDISKFSNSEIGIWVCSFVIAFIVVRHAGSLMGLISGGLNMVIPFFLGV
jgi:hypothetical protein